jgi:ABC-type transport system involved in cytochrome c biogenesis permease subunit
MNLELRLVTWAAGGYGIAAVLYLIGLFVTDRRVRSLSSLAMFISLALYTGSAVLRIADARHLPFQSLYDLLLWFGWWLVVVYLLVEERTGVTLPGLLVAGLSAGVIAGGLLRTPSALVPRLPQQTSLWFAIRAATVYAAYACMAVAALIEVSSPFFAPLIRHESPALVERQERYLEFRAYAYRLILFAFPLLSIGIISNAFWRSTIRGHYWAWGQEETWALVAWILYTAYLHLRTQFRTGRAVATVVSLLGAGSIVLTFTGIGWLTRILRH